MSLVRKIYRKIKRIIKCQTKLIQVVGYSGNFASFKEASDYINHTFEGGGYDADTIFKKVTESTLAVIHGEALFERDSFLFYEKQTNYNLMMYLYKYFGFEEREATKKAGELVKLNVLDFGGSLGSTYLQHKDELSKIDAHWTVTEQPHFVEFGKKNVALENLSFALNEELEDKWSDFNVFLFSSVLQYIENATEMIDKMIAKKCKRIIIERTPVSDHIRYWIETVHEPIYEAVYPCQVFEEESFINHFTNNGFSLVDSWHSLVDGDQHIDGKTIQFKSFVFELK